MAEPAGAAAALDPLDPAYDADVHGALRGALALDGWATTPAGPMALRYEPVAALLRDPRLHELGLDALRGLGIHDGPLWDWWTGLMFSKEGAEHERLRRLVARPMARRAVERLRPTIRAIADAGVDRLLARGEVEFVGEFAAPYALRVMGALLDVDDHRDADIHGWARGLALAFTGRAAEHRAEVEAGVLGLRSLAAELVAERRARPGDDLVSDLVRAGDAGDRLDQDELECLIVHLVFGGYQTTASQLACAVATFLDHPDQWTLLADRPELVGRAVDEVLRYEPASAGAARRVTEDVVVGGVALPAGSLVHPATMAANRDPAAFTDPDRFDITAERAVPHLTFGGGAHFCAGAVLAVAEMEEALLALTGRTVVAATGPAVWQPFAAIRGPIALPVHVAPR